MTIPLFITLLGALTMWAPPVRRTVNIELFKFQPAVVQAAVGDTIVWVNKDIVVHTATATDKSWDSGEIAAKKRGITIARKKGAQDFICLLHPSMKGKLIVR